MFPPHGPPATGSFRHPPKELLIMLVLRSLAFNLAYYLQSRCLDDPVPARSGSAAVGFRARGPRLGALLALASQGDRRHEGRFPGTGKDSRRRHDRRFQAPVPVGDVCPARHPRRPRLCAQARIDVDPALRLVCLEGALGACGSQGGLAGAQGHEPAGPAKKSPQGARSSSFPKARVARPVPRPPTNSAWHISMRSLARPACPWR